MDSLLFHCFTAVITSDGKLDLKKKKSTAADVFRLNDKSTKLSLLQGIPFKV